MKNVSGLFRNGCIAAVASLSLRWGLLMLLVKVVLLPLRVLRSIPRCQTLTPPLPR